jgi:anti-sigma-K factor RskA
VDTATYIQSGAIESYVLGLATPTEMQELETLAAQYPEIKLAINKFEADLENFGIANATEPPVALRAKVLQQLQQETDNNKQAKIVSITAAPKSVKWLRGAVAASIILLLGSAIVNFYLYSQYKKYSGQYTELLAKQNTLLAKTDALQASYNMLKDTSMMQVQLAAASPARAGSLATVLWDTKTKEVYLMVNSLPKHSDDKQYQLWAMVDGKLIDAGMLDMTTANGGLLHMKSMNADVKAFGITLEKKGGVQTPTLDELYVIGKI